MEGTKGKKRPAENSTAGRKAKQQKVENTKGKKNKKEKPAVKRASSAYIYFSKDFRTKLKEKCEKTGDTIPKVNEVAKLAGEEWRKLSAEDKKPFDELARKDRERYQKETGKNVTKDSDKPKRNPTAYFIFLSEFRKKMANQKLPDGQKIPSLAGEKWRTMTDKEKEPYLKEEAKEKAKYEEAMKEYRKKAKDAPKPEKKVKPKKKPEPEEEEEEEDEEEEEEEDDDDDDAEEEDDDDDDDDE
ncbi:high mobility group protein B1 isoform X1 [Exaiptasia diaphana]|uniref:HMG box domain-containing protein n=1 Tax=Exaiptasia diaphana TaxID=2652724 RepID=A0A913YSE6_EXADI|nr:high mobility group protein B1 isoform X1 [Exaiptasia diaphana]